MLTKVFYIALELVFLRTCFQVEMAHMQLSGMRQVRRFAVSCYALPVEKAFSYHNAGGYMNMMLGLVLTDGWPCW